MNLLLFNSDELDGSRLQLRGRRADHVRQVIGAAIGDELRVGQVRGGVGSATVIAISADAVELELGELGEPLLPPPTSIILGVPRPKSVPRIIAAAASLGVARIDLTRAWRVEKSYLDSPVLAPDALDRAARLGCEQGGHTWVPTIELHRRLMPLLDDLPAADTHLIAHPRAELDIEAAAITGSVQVAVGPERGWIDRELSTFEDRGFIAIRAVRGVMRSETAVPVLLGQIELLARLR